MKQYKTRTIAFQELHHADDWSIKIYTISKEGESNPLFFQVVKDQLPDWLRLQNSFNDKNEKIGFLIIHFATEGIFSIINWWVGENMMNTHVFFTKEKDLENFKRISGNGLGPCVWEFEVINHERLSWMKNVLKKPIEPDYETYLNDVYNGEV